MLPPSATSLMTGAGRDTAACFSAMKAAVAMTSKRMRIAGSKQIMALSSPSGATAPVGCARLLAGGPDTLSPKCPDDPHHWELTHRQ